MKTAQGKTRSQESIQTALLNIEEFGRHQVLQQMDGVMLVNHRQYIAAMKYVHGVPRQEAPSQWELDLNNDDVYKDHLGVETIMALQKPREVFHSEIGRSGFIFKEKDDSIDHDAALRRLAGEAPGLHRSCTARLKMCSMGSVPYSRMPAHISNNRDDALLLDRFDSGGAEGVAASIRSASVGSDMAQTPVRSEPPVVNLKNKLNRSGASSSQGGSGEKKGKPKEISAADADIPILKTQDELIAEGTKSTYGLYNYKRVLAEEVDLLLSMSKPKVGTDIVSEVSTLLKAALENDDGEIKALQVDVMVEDAELSRSELQNKRSAINSSSYPCDVSARRAEIKHLCSEYEEKLDTLRDLRATLEQNISERKQIHRREFRRKRYKKDQLSKDLTKRGLRACLAKVAGPLLSAPEGVLPRAHTICILLNCQMRPRRKRPLKRHELCI